LVRLNDGKEFPLNVTLAGAALDSDGTTATVTAASPSTSWSRA
jgi:hypothetical protein